MGAKVSPVHAQALTAEEILGEAGILCGSINIEQNIGGVGCAHDPAGFEKSATSRQARPHESRQAQGLRLRSRQNEEVVRSCCHATMDACD